MHPELAEVVAVLERDLRASAHVPFWFAEETFAPDVSGEWPRAVFWAGEPPAGRGVQVHQGDSFVERLGDLAEFVQEELLDARYAAGLPVYWPQCPAHPHSHPATFSPGDRPHWVCPSDSTVDLGEVGALPREEPIPESQRRRRRPG